jgi:hypothetical protein
MTTITEIIFRIPVQLFSTLILLYQSHHTSGLQLNLQHAILSRGGLKNFTRQVDNG